jgi:hypothetical protein
MDKWVRSFSTWEFTCALITSMTLKLGSFRDVEETLGIARSTFGDAMHRRFHGFFYDLCDLILEDIRGRTSSRKIKRAIREIFAIDSSECQVHGSLFSLPGWRQKYSVRHNAGCKLHTIYNVSGEWIDDFKVTGVRKNDSPIGLQLTLRSGKTYVFDRAYSDIGFWLDIMEIDSHFVTRIKECERTRTLQNNALQGKKNRVGVLWDGDFIPSLPVISRYRDQLTKNRIRHIVYRDPETKKIFHFVTSDLKASAEDICNIYKKRWTVELLFRWLKGHLDIRYMAVKSSNAVKIQMAVAVLVQLLLQLKRLEMNFKGTLWDLLRKLRTNLVKKSLNAGGPLSGCRWKGPLQACNGMT